MIVSWITFLDSIAEIRLINRVYEFLPGLFNMLCDKTKDVNQSADKCLKQFLSEIENQFEKLNIDTTNKILEIILDQTKSMQDMAKQSAFDWLIKFLKQYNLMLNNLSTKNIHFHNKYYKKLNAKGGRLSNLSNLQKDLNLIENKYNKKNLNHSFNHENKYENKNFVTENAFTIYDKKNSLNFHKTKEYSNKNLIVLNENNKIARVNKSFDCIEDEEINLTDEINNVKNFNISSRILKNEISKKLNFIFS